MSPYPRATILDLGRHITALEQHRNAFDELVLAYGDDEPEHETFEDARDNLFEAILMLQDVVMATKATSIAEAVIQAEAAWLRADKLASCELSHEFAKGTLASDIKLIHGALNSVISALAAAMPTTGEDAAVARKLLRRMGASFVSMEGVAA